MIVIYLLLCGNDALDISFHLSRYNQLHGSPGCDMEFNGHGRISCFSCMPLLFVIDFARCLISLELYIRDYDVHTTFYQYLYPFCAV